MQEHGRYEELCAAAAAGQISADELRELRAHMEICNFCKDLQREFVEIGSVCLSESQRLEPKIYNPELALRKKILQNLQNQGAKFSARLQKEIVSSPQNVWMFSRNPFRIPIPVWGVALLLFGLVLGLSIARLKYRDSAHLNLAEPIHSQAVLPTVPETQPLASTRDAGMVKVERENADLQQKLRSSHEAQDRLQSQVAELSGRIAALRDSQYRLLNQVSQLQTAATHDGDATAAAQAQVQKLKADEAAKNAELVAAQYQLRDLERRLAEQAEDADRYRQLMAVGSSTELRDVIAARNLHIIDVADVDNSGVRKPFGRVFYTEGKSLIFYAYDLWDAKGKQTFFA